MMVTQIEEETIKKKLNYAVIAGILYFISALWLAWWENITGSSFLLFLGFTCAAFLVLRLTSRTKMIIVSFIVFLLAVRLLLKYVPRLFLLGAPHFFLFYLFSISIPILHIFCYSHPTLNRYLFLDMEEIKKIDEIVQFRRVAPKRVVLIFILIYLSLSAITSHKIVKMPTIDGHPIPLENIHFFLKGHNVVADPRIHIPWQEVYFGEYYFQLVDKESKLLSVFYTMDYNFNSGIIFGRSFETSVGKGEYFRIGQGEMMRGEFKAIFPKGTKFILLIDVPQGEFGVKDMLLIKLPYVFEKLKLEKGEFE